MGADRPRGRGRRRIGAAFAKLVVIACAVPALAWAAPPGSSLSNEALARCREADRSSGEERERALDEGRRMAERAVAVDDGDAAAHFALFCTLGKRLASAGLGPAMLIQVRRLRHEIDRALELAPEDPELWAAKGAMLLSLPRLFGGDRREAEQLLVRAFVADPDNRATRGYLFDALR